MNINELEPRGTFENRMLQVKNYEEIYDKLMDYLGKECCKDLIIDNPIDLKFTKEKRAELNKLLDKLKRTRTDSVNDLVEVYEGQMKAMEKAVEDTSKTLSKNIKAYEESIKPKEEKPVIYTLCVSSLKKGDLTPIKNLAKELNLKCEIKESK